MARLQDQTILITGASSGFGEAIALACAEEGANVVLVGRRQDALEAVAAAARERGGSALVCPTDVADEAQIYAAVEQAQVAYSSIDVLVNNAGMNVGERSIEHTSTDQWRQVLDVNLTSAFVFAKAVLPGMKARQSGLIINLSSQAGLFPSLGAGVAYSTSKMGMDALNDITNQEGNPYHVRACLLCPGSGNTPLIDQRPHPTPQEQRLQMLQPEDIAATVVFLATLPPRVNVNLILMTPTQRQL